MKVYFLVHGVTLIALGMFSSLEAVRLYLEGDIEIKQITPTEYLFKKFLDGKVCQRYKVTEHEVLDEETAAHAHDWMNEGFAF